MNPLSRRQFVKALAGTTIAAPFLNFNAFAKPSPGVLRHAAFGASGMAWNDLREISKHPGVRIVAICDVDLDRQKQARQNFPEARFYQDWRELLRQEADNIDSVNVSVPDHMHAPIGMSAMRMGKHVYGQKPLAHDLHEVRRMGEFAVRKKIATQMGIQIHSDRAYRTGVKVIQSGTIGKVKEVHSWCPKSWGDTTPRPDRSDAVPEGLDWNLWLGVCANRPYISNAYYHPDNWRKRLDFGTGTFGDMGCHIFDPVFTALELKQAISITSDGAAPNETNWALNSKIHYVYAGTRFTAGDTVALHWYDGESHPPKHVTDLLEGDPLPNTGSVFVGTEGTMVLAHWALPQLYPDKKFTDHELAIIESADHWGTFVEACLGRAKTTAHFGYAGPLTEAVLLGGIASRFPGTTLRWNAARLKFDHTPANAFVKRKYRTGWSVRGLS
jgi:predicted dehydrogenase